MGALVLVEMLLLVRGIQRLQPDRVNFPPAVLLLFLNLTLSLVFSNNPHWPATGYLVGSAGAALSVTGIVLRWS